MLRCVLAELAETANTHACQRIGRKSRATAGRAPGLGGRVEEDVGAIREDGDHSQQTTTGAVEGLHSFYKREIAKRAPMLRGRGLAVTIGLFFEVLEPYWRMRAWGQRQGHSMNTNRRDIVDSALQAARAMPCRGSEGPGCGSRQLHGAGQLQGGGRVHGSVSPWRKPYMHVPSGARRDVLQACRGGHARLGRLGAGHTASARRSPRYGQGLCAGRSAGRAACSGAVGANIRQRLQWRSGVGGCQGRTGCASTYSRMQRRWGRHGSEERRRRCCSSSSGLEDTCQSASSASSGMGAHPKGDGWLPIAQQQA